MTEKNILSGKITFKHQLFLVLAYFILGCQNLMSVPIITSVSPTNGDIAGGTFITIIGSGFSGLSKANGMWV